MARKKTKKNDVIEPLFVKNAQNKTTHVYLSLEDYQFVLKRLKEWDKIQKEKGVKWVKISMKAKPNK